MKGAATGDRLGIERELPQGRWHEDSVPLVHPIGMIFCLIFLSLGHAGLASEKFDSAIELLEVFTGEDATNYAPHFEYSADSRITGIKVYAVGIDGTTARYSGQDEDHWKVVNNILRIMTADGFEAVSGVDSYHQGGYSDAHLRELHDAAEDLVALQSLDPLQVGRLLEARRPDLSDAVRASIDIALWDLAARKAGRPLYAMLGADRNSMEPYASLPFYESLPAYVDAVNEYAEQGYTVFKFHVWGEIDKDMQLVRLVQQTFADTPYRFMIDLESAYDIEEARRLGRQMEKGLFLTLEAPINDELLAEYGALRNELEVLLIPAGYNIYSGAFIRQGIDTRAWDAGRFDVTVVGGITEALRLLTIAGDAGLPIDIQSWGHSLAQAANLHVMLANERSRYFEAPMPVEGYGFGALNGNLMGRGRVRAPDGPGLGIKVDWDALASADYFVDAKSEFSTRTQ